MPRLSRPVFLLLIVALSAFVLAACGEEDAALLPGETAEEITANLQTVRDLADEDDCIGAESAALQVSEQIESLSGIDSRLKQALRDGAARLNQVIGECDEEVEEEALEEEPLEDEETSEQEEAEGKQGNRGNEGGKKGQGNSGRPTPETENPGKGGENKNPGNEGGGQPPTEETEPEEPSGGVSPGTEVGEGG